MDRRTLMAVMGSGLGIAIVAMSAISDARSGRFPIPSRPVGIQALNNEISDLATRLRAPRWTIEAPRPGHPAHS
jgi:hypothetical protein